MQSATQPAGMQQFPYNYYPPPFATGVPPWPMSAPGQAQMVHQPVPNSAPGTGLAVPLPTHSVEYPTIAAWLAYCDKHPGRSGEDLSELLPNFQKEGFRRIHQLTGDRITVEKLAEWVGIGRGTADLLIRYAEEDTELVRAGKFVLSSDGDA